MASRPLLSILIPTLDDRKEIYLDKLLEHLHAQATEEVEVLVLSDQKQQTTGAKRNVLLRRAHGRFSAFVDDDDWVSDTYCADIVEAVSCYPEVQSVGFYGELSFQGNYSGRMVHSIMCSGWYEGTNIYYRPPNHLNPVLTEIARMVQFRNITTSEDHFWSMDLMGTKMLRREVFLGHKPLYYYRCREPRKHL